MRQTHHVRRHKRFPALAVSRQRILGATLSGLFLVLSTVANFAADPVLPDSKLTPGLVAMTDQAKVCATKWGKDERHVTLAMKQSVFAAYGISYARHKEFETDHLVSRELGGADDIRNLWPQSYAGPFGAHQKDRLENKLHKMVCAGRITLADAQNRIATDWIALYRQIFVNDVKR